MADAKSKEVVRVLVTCGVFEPGFRAGGPIRSVAQIIDSAPGDVELILVTADRDLHQKDPYPGLSGRWVRRGRTQIFYLNTRNFSQWLRLLMSLRKTHFDLMYANSFWAPMTTGIPVVLAWMGLLRCEKTIIAPRGEFAAGALSLKARKKRVALRLWGEVTRMAGVRWHATAMHEKTDILKHLPWANIWVGLDQTSLPPVPIEPVRVQDPRARLVYISRIARVKNLDVALMSMKHTSSPFSFDIYGPIEEPKYWAECLALIKELPDHVRVTYHGALTPDQVRAKFSHYDAFVFPTRGENFGYAIAESLSASCPVICTSRTLWTGVLRDGGGIALEHLTPAALGAAIEGVASADQQERNRLRVSAGNSYRKWTAENSGGNVLAELITHAKT